MKVVVGDESVVFVGPLDAGHVAYVDADRLPDGGEAEIEVLVVPEGATADDSGAHALGVLAAPVREALASFTGRVEVVGDGAVARSIRAEWSAQRSAGDAPDVIVDLTGDPEAITAAVSRLADLGTLILAGGPAARPVDLDFYPDVHVRGLRLVGVPDAGNADAPASLVACDGPVEARVGRKVAAGAPWYRVSP